MGKTDHKTAYRYELIHEFRSDEIAGKIDRYPTGKAFVYDNQFRAWLDEQGFWIPARPAQAHLSNISAREMVRALNGLSGAPLT